MKKVVKSCGCALAFAALVVLGACGAGSPKKSSGGGSGAPKPAAGSSAAQAPAPAKLDFANTGGVKGLAKFDGQAPAPRKLDVSKDPWCSKNHDNVMSEELVVDVNGNLRDVVAYVVGLEKYSKDIPIPAANARFEQKGCRYIPHVLAVRAGQTVDLVNADDISHNYHFRGKRNDEINQTQPKPGTDNVTFKRAEMNAVFSCDIHPWMGAKVHIFEHNSFAVSAVDGSFEIKGVPAGNWKVAFVHETAKAVVAEMDVVVAAGQVKDVGTVTFKK